MFVELAKTVEVAVRVAAAVIVEVVVWIVTGMLGVGVESAFVTVEFCGMAEKEAPGVRAASIHPGWARMAGSTGSIKATGLFVRKSLFGSSLDSTFASSSQCGAKRSAQPPADRIPHSPNRRMKAMTAQSLRSCSVALMHASIEWQAHINRSSGIRFFVMTGALNPDASMVCIDNATGDGKSQTGSTTFETGFTGGVQKHFPGLIEFFEDQLLLARINANPCILDGDLDR